MIMNPIESEIYLKLKEAEYQAASVKKRYTHNETMTELKNISLEGASPHPRLDAASPAECAKVERRAREYHKNPQSFVPLKDIR